MARLTNNKHSFSDEIKTIQINECLEDFKQTAPAFKTRLKDKIPIPANIQQQQKAYNVITRNAVMPCYIQVMNISILNRTIWTQEKAHLSKQKDEQNIIVTDKCPQCDIYTEDTVHMLIDCEELAEPLWKELEGVLRDTTQHYPCFKTGPISLQFSNIMYNTYVQGLATEARKDSLMLIQFIKWYIYQQRLQHNNTRNTKLKIRIHLRRILRKLYRYRKFASMGTFFLEKLMQIQDIRITAESDNNDDVD